MWSDEDRHADEDFSHESDNDARDHCRAANIIEDPEVWMDYYSEELLDLWHSLKERCESCGLAILNTCTFPDFSQFCCQFSSGHPPPV